MPTKLPSGPESPFAPALAGLDRRVELDEELVVRVAELAFVDPRREGGEEGDGESREEAGGEVADERVAIRGSRVEGGEERAADVAFLRTREGSASAWRGVWEKRRTSDLADEGTHHAHSEPHILRPHE